MEVVLLILDRATQSMPAENSGDQEREEPESLGRELEWILEHKIGEEDRARVRQLILHNYHLIRELTSEGMIYGPILAF